MKKIKLSILIIFTISFLIIPIIFSCENNETSISKINVLYEAMSRKEFSLENQTELNELAKILAKESGEIKILKDAQILELKDNLGNYKAISVKYKVGGITTNLLVPITEVSLEAMSKIDKPSEAVNYYMVAPCEMKCTADNCNVCTQKIIERCKSQTCTCEGFSSGCNPSIIFPE